MFVWNHNTHYHKLLLKQLPDKRDSALDIGSGFGLFSFKLSSIYNKIVCIEPDLRSIEYSKKNYGILPNLTYINSNFLEHNFEDQKFDFIVAIASIHHMDFEESLKRMRSLLSSGGKLFILGLYKESSIMDFLVSIVAILPNFILNLFSQKDKAEDCEMIMTSATMTINDIKKSASKVLKYYRFRRHLFWRYSLQYRAVTAKCE